MNTLRRPCAVLISLALVATLDAQTLTTWLPLDGSTADATGTTGQTVFGGSPNYQADRLGAAASAWRLDGSSDFLRLTVASSPGNSAAELGIQGVFTASAWVRPDTPGSGDNMVFGMEGSGAGTVNFGIKNGRPYLGMFGNDLQGSRVLRASQWYNLTYQYDGVNQRIFVNGIPDATRAAANTAKDADLLVGRAFSSSGSQFDGRIDEVAIFDAALSGGQVLDLVGASDPSRLAEVPADPLPGKLGSAGNWGVREIKGHSALSYDHIVNALAICNNQGGGTVSDGLRPVLNLSDPQTSNNAGNFGGDLAFVSNTGGSDNNFALIGQAFVNIPTSGDYTFGFSGDDGARLRIWGQDFTSAVTVSGGNAMEPPFAGDQIIFTNPTGNGTVLGVVNLEAGVYLLEHVWWEGGGGAWTEVYAAPGAKTSLDGSFELVGDTASGGLQIVAPRPLIKYFDVDQNVITDGSPATVTLSWDTLFDTSLQIDNSVGSPGGSSVTIPAPANTTTYTLTAERSGGGTATAALTVFVDPPPSILSFAADDATVAPGTPVTLSWEAIAGTTFTLNPGGINVTGDTIGQTGSVVVNPSSTATYTLAVTNANGSTLSDPQTVTTGPPPTIDSFTVNDSTPAPGAVLTLAWDVSDADTLTIDNGVGDVSALAQAYVCPVGDTTYTLAASNDFATVSAQVSVATAQAIGVASPGFTVRFVASNGSISDLASADSALAGFNVANERVLTEVAAVNYTDSGTKGEVAGDATFPPGFTDDFVMQATATLVVNVAGSYTFAINNDDGGRLRIDGADVIVDDALHGPRTTTGSVNLSAGNHSIDYVFFERGGGAAGELFLQPQPGIAELLMETGDLGAVTTATVIINEIMADNDRDVIVDGDGDASDWIELYNGTGAAVDLSGWFLTDDPLLPNKWQFPPGSAIADGGFLLVWASDKALATPPAGELHTNFKLSAGGEYLALVGPDGESTVDELAPGYPPQSNGVSWGTFDTEQYTGFFVDPTPGGRNLFGYEGLVGDTQFSVDRGFHGAPFQLAITSSTPDAVIYYTTDGTEPTDKNATNGTLYSGPITVDSTTVIRARATKAGHFPSNVDTQTYLFVDDIVSQNPDHAHGLGFPDANVNGQRFEYGMNLAAGGSAQRVKDSLLAIPSISLVMDQEDFSEPVNGIYVNASSRGLERSGSIELINEDGLLGGQFQVDCGVRIRGGFSRSGNNPKHAFRFFFRKTYGPGKLDYPLFGDEGANEFDGVDLRTSQNYSWAFQNSNQNTFLREVWGRDTQREMGQPYTRSRYYHLYINGHYWGLYMTQERSEADFGETYFGGRDDDYDTVKSAGNAGGYRTEVTDGNFDDWYLLWDWDNDDTNGAAPGDPSNTNYFAAQGLLPDGVTPNGGPVVLDVDNLIDYMLVIFYDGSFDAPLSTFLRNASNNWFGVRNRASDDMGFAFFVHDNEHGMGSANDSRSDDRTGPWGPVYETITNFDRSNPQYLHEDLAKNAEYRLAFADRAHAALVAPGGALTIPEVKARILERAATVETVIDAEAARWGSTSLNKNAWQGARDRLLDWVDDGDSANGGPDRTQVILAQLRSYADGALYPDLDAPVYSQQGGNVPAGYPLTMTNPDGVGTIYYTTDGSDPREVGGAISSAAFIYSSGAVVLPTTTTVRARIKNGAGWSAMNDATFLIGGLADATNLVISKLYYNPPGQSELTEYIEVMNISAAEIELAGISFVSGLSFDFSTATDTTLDPGERAVIVKDVTAFNTAFAGSPPVHLLGTYTGSLDNGGERIALLAANGDTIRDFDYNDKFPWPESPDGDGAALVLVDPLANPDHADPANWRPSVNLAGGTPGADDGTNYTSWKSANGVTGDGYDLDGDEMSATLEYGFGGDPNVADAALILPTASIRTLSVDGALGEYLTIEFRRNLAADDLIYSVEISTDMVTWNGGPSYVVEEDAAEHNGDGTETALFSTVDPISPDERLFIRGTITTVP